MDHPERGEEHSDVLQRESDRSQPSDQETDDVEARSDFWSTSGNHNYRHHVELRVNLYVPNEGLKYIDVVRRKILTLDERLECRIDNDWNADVC